MVRRARLRIEARVDEGERPAGLEPAPDDRQELGEPIARDVAEPEPGEHGVDLSIGFRPGVTDMEMGAETVGHEPLPGPVERRARRVIERQLALAGQQRRPPAGPGGQLDDLAVDRQGVEPAPGCIELGVPGRVVDRPARVAAAAEVPVVVLGRPSLVVRDHLGVAVRGRRVGGRSRAAAGLRRRAARRSSRRTRRRRPACPRPRARSAPAGGGTGGSRSRRPSRRNPGTAAPNPRGRRSRGRRAPSRTRGSRTCDGTA